MSEQYPSPPQQPPQGNAPYGQPQASFPGPSHAQPYGSQGPGLPPNQYGQYAPSPGAQRPGVVTGAGTLGIVSGGLGIISGFLTLISTSALSKPIRQARLKAESLQTLAMLGYIQGFGVFLTAVALLASGIMFLNSKGYPVLLYGAFAQAGFTLANSVITLMTPSLLGVDKAANGSTLVGFNVGTALNLIIGLGLAGFTIYLLNTPATKAWRK